MSFHVSRPQTLKKLSVIILAIGILQFFGAIYFYTSTASFLKKAKKANGKVVRVVKKKSSSSNDNSTYYYPVFNFKDDNGKTHIIKSEMGSSPAPYEVGEDVEIFYNPDNPKDNKINSLFQLWGMAMILGGLFLSSLITSLVFHLVGKRQG